MLPKRFDSLFLRLVTAQALLVLCAMPFFGGILLVERNVLLATQYARVFAPQALAAARLPVGTTLSVDGLDGGIHRHAGLPTGFKVKVTAMPAVSAFTNELQRAVALQTEEVWLNHNDRIRPAMWLRVRTADLDPVWLSAELPAPMLPHLTASLGVGLGLLAGVFVLMSRHFARRVTNPLARLRQRMERHANAGILPDEVIDFMAGSRAPPELIAIDAAYRKLAQRLQRSERERAMLLAGVSHDLRSPLSRIRLAAEMLPETSENAAGVATITRNVDHADQLTATFIEFIRAGVVQLNEAVDLAELAREAVAGFGLPTEQLRAELPQRLRLHQAHGVLVERLIVNLIDNALKHGGTPVEVRLQAMDGAALLTVSDSGTGLPGGATSTLMEAFARGDVSRNVPGFGLGLAIVQQTVERLQGQLSFAQEAGWHRVSVSLPLSR
jgi:two-component system osmolarity sensor histidine kinase EnvZ